MDNQVHHGSAPAAQNAMDPVCGMTVDPHKTPHQHSYRGQPHYFCSAGCRSKFAADPDKYLASDQREAEPVPEGTIYTCPMHPQIRQVGPGVCPICGMALEPVMPAAVEDDTESRRVGREFRVSVGFAVPVTLLAMVPHLSGLHYSATGALVSRGIELLLSAPVVLWAAADYYRRGWIGIVNRTPNMYTLIGLGVLVSFLYSLVATFAPGVFPPEMRDE